MVITAFPTLRILSVAAIFFLFFFFSSRRRHTTYIGDWSSDVCSSDLSLEPRWFLSPYVAVWAVRSRANPDRVGWWAISGDLPTDYMTCGREQEAGDILIGFEIGRASCRERV